MSIKRIRINNLASFQNFDFDISNKDSYNKYVLIFGSNGSGKSSLVNMIQKLNSYCINNNPENLCSLQDYLSNRISKESLNSEIKIDIEFDTFTKSLLYHGNDNNLKIDNDSWQKIKIFNEDYTNKTISNNINIDFEESGLIIGAKNKELEKERIKLKNLTEEKLKKLKEIEILLRTTKSDYINESGSKSEANLNLISKESFLSEDCPYIQDKSVIDKREKLGKKVQKQKSNNIDISMINESFDIDYWESLFVEEINEPILSDEYKNLLIKYSNFYEEGTKINDNTLMNKCPYCLQKWNQKNQIFDDFQNYLTSEYNTKKEKLLTLNNILSEFEFLLKTKNRDIELQDNVVREECDIFDIDSSDYKVVQIDKIKFKEVKDLIKLKIENMHHSYSIKESLNNLISNHYISFNKTISILERIKYSIAKRSKIVQTLNTKVSEYTMMSLWINNTKLRDSFNYIEKIISDTSLKIAELEVNKEDINTIQQVFNGLVEFIGLEEYHLNTKNILELKLDLSYDISEEGMRISTAQKKILSLCYFYAELISSVSNEKELKEYTIIYDDPLDSADYVFFHSITSLIENIEIVLSKILVKDTINIGQHIVFTHNSLLYNRLSQNFRFHKKMNKINKQSVLNNADKIENNYKIYIELIVEFYKKDENIERDNIFIGNLIRRVLEIIISFNELNSNNISSIKDYGKPTLGLIANHLSHESFSKVLNPLPANNEMKKACKELFEVIEEHHPTQYKYIKNKLLTP